MVCDKIESQISGEKMGYLINDIVTTGLPIRRQKLFKSYFTYLGQIPNKLQ